MKLDLSTGHSWGMILLFNRHKGTNKQGPTTLPGWSARADRGPSVVCRHGGPRVLCWRCCIRSPGQSSRPGWGSRESGRRSTCRERRVCWWCVRLSCQAQICWSACWKKDGGFFRKNYFRTSHKILHKGAIQMLCNAKGLSNFQRKRYEGVQFNKRYARAGGCHISRKEHYATLEGPQKCNSHTFTSHNVQDFCYQTNITWYKLFPKRHRPEYN